MSKQRKYGKSAKELRETELRRVNRLKAEWEAKGYFVMTNEQFHAGVDLVVVDTSLNTFNIVRVIESTNWNSRGYLNNKRFDRYKESLNRFEPTTREIVFSYESNLSPAQKKEFEDSGIIVTILDYQD